MYFVTTGCGKKKKNKLCLCNKLFGVELIISLLFRLKNFLIKISKFNNIHMIYGKEL
jgi:hypothetical protein